MRSSELSDVMTHQYDTCARCGRHYLCCDHINTHRNDITPEHAARIRAAYLVGRQFNPDHDTTSYWALTGGLTDIKDPDPTVNGGPAAGLGRRLPITVGGAPVAGPLITKD